MRKIALPLALAAIAAAATLGFSPARAADLPSKKSAPSFAAPANDWNGFYFGISGGYAFAEAPLWSMEAQSVGYQYVGAALSPVYQPFAWASNASLATNTGGPIGAVFAGYGFQFGKFVVGPEAEFGVPIGSSKTATFATPGLGYFPQAAQLGHAWDYAIIADARIGYEIVPGWLPFVKGGLAIVQTSASVTSGDAYSIAAGYGSTRQAYVGWNVGGGVDWRVPAFPGLTVGLAFDHIDAGHRTASTTGISYGSPAPALGALATQFVAHGATRTDVVKIRLGFQFDSIFGAWKPYAPTGNFASDVSALNSRAQSDLATINSIATSKLNPTAQINAIKQQLNSAGLPN